MLSWLFKNRDRATPPAAAPLPAKPPAAAAGSAAGAGPGPDEGIDWPARLNASFGDDEALLELARAAPLLAVKMAAVEALASEAALKRAERAFRDHDRKVHRRARQRLEAAVAQRQARAAAEVLLLRLAALHETPSLPINHVVDFDREWEALPPPALDDSTRARHSELRARLDARIRDQDLAQQALRRWTADARQALLDWERVASTLADGGPSDEVCALVEPLQTLRGRRPDSPTTASLDASLAAAIESSAALGARLGWLESSIPLGLPPPEADTAPEAVGPGALPAAVPDWDALPLPMHADLIARLEQRYRIQWAGQAQAAPAPALPPLRPVRPHLSAEQRAHIEALMGLADRALAEGQIAELGKHLLALDATVGLVAAAALPEALRARHQALRTEAGRLHGWRQWGGARARDELVVEAEALARSTQATQTSPAPSEAPGAEIAPDPKPPAAARPKLNVQEQAQRIQSLRSRWKALDRQGAAASTALWQRFDAALQTAHQPVAAHLAVLKAAREDNQAAREALLARLQALPLPGAVESEAGASTMSAPLPAGADRPPPGAQDAGDDVPGATSWRQVQRELQEFQAAWRKLGPIEHTVPTAARAGLQQRWAAAIVRAEGPLQDARNGAAGAREDLIVRATELLPAMRRGLPLPDLTRQVRELQAQWQHQARLLPLPRGRENDLWTRFKAATDAVFAERAAASAAREAEVAAALASREALLQRLASLDAHQPLAVVDRTLAEIDREWRQAGELPRGGPPLENRYRAARAAALQLREEALQRHRLAQFDALVAALDRCEAHEDRIEADGPSAWAPDERLPVAWNRALAQRWSQGASPAAPPTGVDECLLRLEMAAGLPVTPEGEAARRELKLRALKAAMEGRIRPGPGKDAAAEGLLSLLRQRGLTASQRQRLREVIAGMRRADPGLLGTV